MRAVLLVLTILVSHSAFSRGLDGTKWRVKSHKLVGEEPAWTNEEAEAVTGKTVSFSKEKFRMGETTCKLKITPQQEGRRWTAGETDPCNGEDKVKGMVYALSYEDCSARFPGIVVIRDKQAVAFGDGVSFCLEKK